MQIPAAIKIWGFSIHLYGLMIALGLLAGMRVVEEVVRDLKRDPKKYQIDLEKVESELWSGLGWGIIGAVLGARLYHVLDEWNYYGSNLGEVFMIWHGGLGIYGGLLGGGLGLVFYTRWIQARKGNEQGLGWLKKLWFYLDLAAVGMPLGQAIGRWGNYFNQELYGIPTKLPWGIVIQPMMRAAGYEAYQYFHPLFAYESGWSLLTFGLVYGLGHKRWKWRFGSANYLAVYLGMYALGRWWTEWLRIDPWRWGMFTVAQWISMLLLGMLVVKMMLRWRKNHETKKEVR